MSEAIPAATPAGQRAVYAAPLTADRLRAIIAGPRGGGTTRRRASDAFRFGFPVLAVAASIPVIQRLFTAYLSPIWGWVTLAWMRRREHV